MSRDERRTLSKALLAAAIGVVGLTGAAGCGEKVIDSTKVEDAINSDLEESGTASQVKSVECPEDEPSEDGHRFDCTLTGTDDSTAAVPVVVEDGEAGDIKFGQEAR